MDSAESGTPAGRGRDMRPAAGAPRLVQVVLHPLRRRGRDLLLLIRPGNPQVSGIRQVTAARARALGDSGPRSGPGPPTSSTRPGCPAASPASSSSARSAARRCFRGGFRPGRSSELGGIEEFPLFRDPARSAAASRSRRSATTASSAAIRSACAADQRITRIPWRRVGHSPKSSRKPRTATTTTPHPPPERNPDTPWSPHPGQHAAQPGAGGGNPGISHAHP